MEWDPFTGDELHVLHSYPTSGGIVCFGYCGCWDWHEKKCNGNPLLNILRWYTVYLHMCEQKESSKSLLSQKKSMFDDRISCLERGVEFLLVSPIGLWTYALNSINLMVVRAGRPANFLKKLLQWFTGLITFCLAAKASTWRSYHV